MVVVLVRVIGRALSHSHTLFRGMYFCACRCCRRRRFDLDLDRGLGLFRGFCGDSSMTSETKMSLNQDW